MRVLGIVAEYNPFHNGHLYHLNESKRVAGADASVAVMSGNFMQRGEAALLSKWDRAKIAVDCGVDLVLELPFVYACNNAEYFAHGAVQILNGLSCVDVISFGSETGDIDKLRKAAQSVLNETGEFKKIMRESLENGYSFPRARAAAILRTAGAETAEIFSTPNNILAVEYIKQLMLTESTIVPMTFMRRGQAYDSKILQGEFASAVAIRACLEEKNGIHEIQTYVPEACFYDIKNINIADNKKLNSLFLLISAKILTESEDVLGEIFSAGEGLHNRLKKVIMESGSLPELVSKTKSKRYTMTRIQRLLTHTLIGLKTSDFQAILDSGLTYARVLAFNEKGAKILKMSKIRRSGMPLITNIRKQVMPEDEINKLLAYDIMASDIYNLISGRDLYRNSDFVVAPYHK